MLLDIIQGLLKIGMESTTVPLIASYLMKYGYIQNTDNVSKEDIAKAITDFHKMVGMQGDTITPQTVRVMGMPRCCVQDVLPLMAEENGIPKWAINNLTYFIEERDNDISAESWDNGIKIALDSISKICNLKFSKTNDKNSANIVYGIGRGRKDNFDGSSGTLAWMQLPPSSNFRGQLNGKFDADERWVGPGQNGPGILFVNVCAHETGHALGLSHTDAPRSLMNPFYSESIAEPQREDIRQLVLRYGNAAPNPTPTPTPTPAPNPPSSPFDPNDQLVINIKGVDLSQVKIEIPGFRVNKLG